MVVSWHKVGRQFFELPFSRMEIASLLGLSEETVCRLMADLKRSGAIYAPRGKIEIRDWNQLCAISDGHSGGACRRLVAVITAYTYWSSQDAVAHICWRQSNS